MNKPSINKLKFVFLTGFLLFCLGSSKGCDSNILMWFSFDGVAHNFLNSKNAPFTYELSRKGMYSVDGMETSFVTVTYPNHFSLATGLYTEVHGVINNEFSYDNRNFTYTTIGKYWWDEYNTTIPIWTANELAGKKSAVINWVGAATSYQGVIPTFLIYGTSNTTAVYMFEKIYNELITCEYSLLMGYVVTVDSTGHKYGISGEEYTNAIKDLDNDFKNFYTKLQENGYIDKISFVITSDHGMQDVGMERTRYVSDYTNVSYEVIYEGVFVLLSTNGSSLVAKALVKDLNAVNEKKWFAYLKSDIPTDYHFTKNKRIPDVVIVVHDTWCMIGKRGVGGENCKDYNGQHGYPHQIADSMKAIFLASGPMFPQGVPQRHIENVDVYSLVCNALGINTYCNPSNGSYEKFTLTNKNSSAIPDYAYWLVGIIAFLILIIAGFFVYIGVKRNSKINTNRLL